MSNGSIDPRIESLLLSAEMDPVAGDVEIRVPVSEFWALFQQPNLWSQWNTCFYWAHNRTLIQGDRLTWVFQPIRPWYLYKMPAIASIAEVVPQARATWDVTTLPGFFARHTYHLEKIDQRTSRFGSWEQAMGPAFQLTRGFWVAHFRFVLERSLEGARRLEAIYEQHGRLARELLPQRPLW